MVSTQAKLALDGGLGAAGATAQFVLIKHYVDRASGAKPLFTAPAMLPGLGEYATITSLVGGAAALGYELFKGEVKKQREITDVDMGLIAYGASAITSGVLNMIVDPPDLLGSINPVVSPQTRVPTAVNPNKISIYGSYSQ